MENDPMKGIIVPSGLQEDATRLDPTDTNNDISVRLSFASSLDIFQQGKFHQKVILTLQE